MCMHGSEKNFHLSQLQVGLCLSIDLLAALAAEMALKTLFNLKCQHIKGGFPVVVMDILKFGDRSNFQEDRQKMDDEFRG